MAFDPRMIDDLARRLAGAVPENVSALRRDLEQNFKGVLPSQLTRLDLVTREEFDVQSAVLRRTREKLAVLEQRLAGFRRTTGRPEPSGGSPGLITVIGSYVSPFVRKVLACLELKQLEYRIDPITPFFRR